MKVMSCGRGRFRRRSNFSSIRRRRFNFFSVTIRLPATLAAAFKALGNSLAAFPNGSLPIFGRNGEMYLPLFLLILFKYFSVLFKYKNLYRVNLHLFITGIFGNTSCSLEVNSEQD